jgi:ribonuclease BN (tRNA processing enzyme)
MLLDLGSGSLRSLARLGEPFETLSAVGLTHRHMDHVADLLPLLFALRNTPGLARRERLVVFGYPGLRADLERLAQVFGRWVLEPGFDVEIRELFPGEVLELEGIEAKARVSAHPVRHSPEAVGFRIEILTGAAGGSPARSFAYSGDSGATDTLVDLAAGVDLFVCECSFPDDQAVEGHLTPSQLLPICASAGARRTVATHFYPVWDERGVERLWSESLARFGGEVPLIAAHDGLDLEINGETTC